MKTLIGVNVLTHVNSYVYSNHCQFWFRLAKHFPDHDFIFYTPARMSIDRMRNSAAKIALENDCDYIMFIDDDVLVPFNAYELFLKSGYDIIAGQVYIRGYPFNIMAFKEVDEGLLEFYNDFRYHVNSLGIVDCAAIGFSCAMINTAILRKLEPPYFVTGTYNTEDVYFCLKARYNIPDIKIGMHTEVKCGHLLDVQACDETTVEALRQYHETLNPDLKSRADHSSEDITKCLNAIGLT